MFMIGPSRKVPVCLDCYIKWSQVNQQTMENLERRHNMLVDEVELTWGTLGSMPTYPPRSIPTMVISGGLTLHNISIANSNVGVVNSGTIGTIRRRCVQY